MRLQALCIRQLHDILYHCLKPGRIVFQHTHPSAKIIYAQRRGVFGRAARGQHMVGARQIIAQRFRRIGAQKYAASMADAGQQRPRVCR